MSDRGLPPDTSPACPFVAFEDDRDGRSTRPDQRHRCFAELRPAPRATAHQEAFCLSPGFVSCPTFVDWARREAARVRPALAPGVVPDEPPDDSERGSAASSEVAAMAPVRDSDRRDWAAPPPWAGGVATGAAMGASAAERTGPPAEGVPAIGQAAPPEPGVEAPSFLATRAAEAPRATEPPRAAEPPRSLEPDRPVSATGAPPPVRSRPTPPADLDDELEAGMGGDEGWAEPESAERPMRRFGPASGRSRFDDTHTGREAPRRRPPADDGGPSWEKPRRYEAYPTLRTRTGLSGVSPVLAAGIVIVLAAAALFFLPSFLLGLGGDDEATSTPSASGATASATLEGSPSPSPAPTPFVYTVKTGDTLSGIADQFDVTLDDLISANPTLEDPDKLDVGDKLIIPIGGLQASPSPSPATSPSP